MYTICLLTHEGPAFVLAPQSRTRSPHFIVPCFPFTSSRASQFLPNLPRSYATIRLLHQTSHSYLSYPPLLGITKHPVSNYLRTEALASHRNETALAQIRSRLRAHSISPPILAALFPPYTSGSIQMCNQIRQ